jgi:simple sugar transport system ATP-binding protein
MLTDHVLLEMEHISKRFSDTVLALKDVSFQLQKGEIHALLGENGAGKSTLIKVLTGVEKRSGGSVFFEGKELHLQSPQEAQRIGISTVYQEVNLCPNLSVAENIYIGREPMKRGRIDWNTMNRDAVRLLDRFDLNINVTRNLDRYCVAVQQMVAIARASDISLKVLILDEPTSSLSRVEVEKLFQIMRRLREEGMGIIFVTHFLDQVYEISDRITVLRNGEYAGTYETGKLPKVELVGKMIGKDYEELSSRLSVLPQKEEEGEDFLRLERLCAAGTVRDMDLSVRHGEVLGLSGLLGSGRSETVRLIFGLDKVEKGKLELKGRAVRFKGTLEAIRCCIAFCPEDRKTDGKIGRAHV